MRRGVGRGREGGHGESEGGCSYLMSLLMRINEAKSCRINIAQAFNKSNWDSRTLRGLWTYLTKSTIVI